MLWCLVVVDENTGVARLSIIFGGQRGSDAVRYRPKDKWIIARLTVITLPWNFFGIELPSHQTTAESKYVIRTHEHISNISILACVCFRVQFCAHTHC